MIACTVCSFANSASHVLCEMCQSPLGRIMGEAPLKACPVCTALNREDQVLCTVCDSSFITAQPTNLDLDVSVSDDLLCSTGENCPRCTVVIQPQSIAQKFCDCCGHSFIAEKSKGNGKRKKGGNNSNNSRANRETQAIQFAANNTSNDANEIHFGSTQSTTGLIELLDSNLKNNAHANNRYRLVSPCTHLTQANAEGSTWACGYRNFQMLCLSLMKVPAYRLRLFNGDGDLPDIHGLQAWIEKAWSSGFDQQGSMDFQGQLLGKNDWIGAVEGAALLRFFGIRCHVVQVGDKKFFETIMAGGGINSVARYHCDLCSSQIHDSRFRCTIRQDFDLCRACYNKWPQDFPMKEIPIQKSVYVKNSHPATHQGTASSSSFTGSSSINTDNNGVLDSAQLLNNFMDSKDVSNTKSAAERERVDEDEENMKLAMEASLREFDEGGDEAAFGYADPDSDDEEGNEKESNIGEKGAIALDDDVVYIDVDKIPPRKRAASDGSGSDKGNMGDGNGSISNDTNTAATVPQQQQQQQHGKKGKPPRGKKQVYAENAKRLEDWIRRYFDAFSSSVNTVTSKDIRSFMKNGAGSSSAAAAGGSGGGSGGGSSQQRSKGQSNSLRNLNGSSIGTNASSNAGDSERFLSEAELQTGEMQSLISEHGLDHTISPFVHPIFLQHQGHSRTIVGFEEVSKPQRKTNLLLFDPSFKGGNVKDKLSKALDSHVGKSGGKGGKKKGRSNKKDTNWQQLVKRQLSTFNKGVYQLLFVNGIMSDKEREDSRFVQVKTYDEELNTEIKPVGR